MSLELILVILLIIFLFGGFCGCFGGWRAQPTESRTSAVLPRFIQT